MKTLWLLLAIAVPLQSIHAQEVKHATTVEQCRADQKLWLAKLEQDPLRSGVANISFRTLGGWADEMMDCQQVDPESAKGYYNTYGEATSEQLVRLMNFLGRHKLFDQFATEDEQGKR